jgi:hypothetical protein
MQVNPNADTQPKKVRGIYGKGVIDISKIRFEKGQEGDKEKTPVESFEKSTKEPCICYRDLVLAFTQQ